MKICHISESAGGVEHFILNILKNSDSSKFTYYVICPNTGINQTLGEKAKELTENVFMVPMDRPISIFKDIKSILKILTILKQIKPDLIHGHSGKGGLYSRVCGFILQIPVFFTPHSFSFLGKKGLTKSLILFIEKNLQFHGAYLLPSSKSEKNIAINIVKWRICQILSIFPNSLMVSDSIKKDSNNKTLHIISLARLTYQKNPLLFLKVAESLCEKYNNLTFSIIGAGYADDLGKIVNDKLMQSRFQERIKIKPWVSQETMIHFLENSDIYLSTSRYEGLPTVLLMAMDKELPIIATDVAGNQDVVEHGETGFLAKNENELLNQLNILCIDAELRKQFGKKGKLLLIDKFNIKKNIIILEQHYLKFS